MKVASPWILTAENADKYSLYTQAFQDPPADVRFCRDLFQQTVGRSPVSLREDFCGTAAVACEWAHTCEERMAIGIDIDPEPLDWCRRYSLPRLALRDRRRIELVCDNVLSVDTAPTDIILALNSSFCVLKQRHWLLTYFTRCNQSLKNEGMLVLGLYAGPEAQMTGIDELSMNGFEAVWEQSEFNSVTNEAINRIHFRFPDGSSIRHAFIYNWRMWSPRELTDALCESGIREVRVYSRSQTRNGQKRIEECKAVQVNSYWDTLVVGFK